MSINMTMPTLSEFFEASFNPVWIGGKHLDPKTLSSYRESMAHWSRLTQDPPVDQITDLTTSTFIAELCKLPGKKAATMAMSSVLKHARNVDTVLKLTGPRTRHNRKGQGVIDYEPPFIDLPRVDQEPPNGDWSIEELRAMYGAAEAMRHPQVPGVEPADWWRTLVTVAYFAGLRIYALTNVEFSHITGQWINVPARLSKRRKGKRQYLHREALEHIERIRGDRAIILPWPKWSTCKRYAYTRLNQLQKAAGLPECRWFGFQAFRKTHLTQLAMLSLAHEHGLRVAQQSASHSSLSITLSHYVNGSVQERMVAEAIDRMPSPCVPFDLPASAEPEPEQTEPENRIDRYADWID